MEYADFSFYQDKYYGDVISEQCFGKWISKASDEIDMLTFRRLQKTFPVEEGACTAIKKAVCEIAELLFSIDVEKKAASVSADANGYYTGNLVASVKSGSESISYTTERNSLAATLASDSSKRRKAIFEIAQKYLRNVPDAHGTLLLFAGIERRNHVQRHNHCI